MKACDLLQRVVLEIVRKLGITSEQSVLHVRLRHDNGHELLIEEDLSTRRARIAFYMPDATTALALQLEMELLAHVNSRGQWWPYEIYYRTQGRRTVAQPLPEIGAIVALDLEGQWQLAGLADLWAGVLLAGFWFDPSIIQVVEPQAKAPRQKRQPWPEPTMEAPDMETLEGWTFDSICEATDGCPIEADGICEHGHPSWLLRLGLV